MLTYWNLSKTLKRPQNSNLPIESDSGTEKNAQSN